MKVPVLRIGFALACMLVLLAGTAGAVTITVDGDISDWGVSTALMNASADPTNAAFFAAGSGISQAWEDGPNSGSSGYVGPGYGGQNFDLEAMYAYYDTSVGPTGGLYLAIVTGFDQGGVYSWGGGSPMYRPGDVFVDFAGNIQSWDLGIETYANQIPAPGDPPGTGGIAGNVYTGTGTWWTPPIVGAHSTSSPSEINHDLATDLGTTAFEYSDAVPDASGDDNLVEPNPLPHASGGNPLDWNPLDHNVIEVFLSNSFLTSAGYNPALGFTVVSHWTEQCGNDVLDNSLTVSAVPEPLTMVMLGCLGAGMMGARKLARRKSS